MICEELFGPVAPVVPFDSEEQVLAWANSSPVGLAAYVHTGDIGRALRMTERLEGDPLCETVTGGGNSFLDATH